MTTKRKHRWRCQECGIHIYQSLWQGEWTWGHLRNGKTGRAPDKHKAVPPKKARLVPPSMQKPAQGEEE